jgi:hypothetical protein
MARISAATLLILGIAAPVWAQLQGIVRDDDGNPVAGAQITAYLAVAEPSSRFPSLPGAAVGQRAATASTATNGAFTLSGLAAGRYVLCVQSAQGLDPCNWGTALTATLAAGQTRTGLQIRLPAISQLRVRLEDPSALLAERHVQTGVLTPRGLFSPARLVSEDPTGRNLVVDIPLGARVRLQVSREGS